MTRVSAARGAAFQILLAVERGKAHSDDLLRGSALSALSAPDRSLATTLVLGVLRWQIQLDEQVRKHLKKPNARLDREVQIALRLGAFQLLHLDRIPARAAIDESVELAKQAGHRFAAGMVNAVLRKLASTEGASESQSAEAAYPAWMVERWMQNFGEQGTCAICRSGQAQPTLTIRLVDAAAEAELIRAGVQMDEAELLTSARSVLAGDVFSRPAFLEGRVRVQDEGSQLVAEIAGRGSRILDCCAAPGGKTLVLAERNPEARIVACEVNPQRATLLRQRVAAFEPRVECREEDVVALTDRDAYDLVLADVPCSGTGTLGRNPEIRHRVQPQDFQRQAERQRAILAAAIRAAQPAGRIVYATCSLEPEENEQVIAATLLEEGRVRVVPLDTRLEQMREDGILTADGAAKLKACITTEGFLRLFPGVLGTDGFFVAMLEKLA